MEILSIARLFCPQSREKEMDKIRNECYDGRNESEVFSLKMEEFERVVPGRTEEVAPSFLDRLIGVHPNSWVFVRVADSQDTGRNEYLNACLPGPKAVIRITQGMTVIGVVHADSSKYRFGYEHEIAIEGITGTLLL